MNENVISKRKFCFFQGPISPFYNQLAKEFKERGYSSIRLTICKGDELFWSHAICKYTGKFEDFDIFLENFIREEKITDVIMFHDCRPFHRKALKIAKKMFVLTWIFEIGYLRPNYFTIETNGFNTYSTTPKNIDFYRKYNKNTKKKDVTLRVTGAFKYTAVYDFYYNFVSCFSYIFFRTYKYYTYHRLHRPAKQYIFWVKRFFAGFLTKHVYNIKAENVLRTLSNKYFFFPLQISDDYQIREHSPFKDMPEGIKAVMKSFAKFSKRNDYLVIKTHPIDPLIINYSKLVNKIAKSLDIHNRIIYIQRGNTPSLIKKSKGIVTVNSTVGLQAIFHGRPTKVLGEAIYDIETLTYKGKLNDFWSVTKKDKPNIKNYYKFRKYLLDNNQVVGEFYTQKGIKVGVKNCSRFILG